TTSIPLLLRSARRYTCSSTQLMSNDLSGLLGEVPGIGIVAMRTKDPASATGVPSPTDTSIDNNTTTLFFTFIIISCHFSPYGKSGVRGVGRPPRPPVPRVARAALRADRHPCPISSRVARPETSPLQTGKLRHGPVQLAAVHCLVAQPE